MRARVRGRTVQGAAVRRWSTTASASQVVLDGVAPVAVTLVCVAFASTVVGVTVTTDALVAGSAVWSRVRWHVWRSADAWARVRRHARRACAHVRSTTRTAAAAV